MLFYNLLDIGSNYTGYYRQYYRRKTKFSSCSLFFSTIYTSPLAWTIFVYALSQSRNREKFFLKQNIKVRMPTLVGNKQLFHPYPPSWEAPFQSFNRKWTAVIRQRWTSKCLFPRRHIVYSLKKCISSMGKCYIFLPV